MKTSDALYLLYKCGLWIATFLLIVVLVAACLQLHYSPTYFDGTPRPMDISIYEDGSFVIFQIAGCVPFNYCT